MRKYRICLLCDSLSLGGVETHVVTLASRLAREGHDVTVISGGGVLTEALVGVTHITLPLRNKKKYLSLMLRLRRLFKQSRFDVIHAHTRFSAFLCRPLVKERLVTTAHWVFDTRFPKGRLTTWGDETLAVSRDIAAYLEKGYRLPSKSVSVTVNGIDTERFSPCKTKNDARKIVYCSRLDRDRADVAFLLLEAIAELEAYHFSLHILGEGERFAELKEKADALLQQKPHLSLRLWGGVSDVASHLKDADILVGVSRAALEGMSAGTAVILAGNEGYLSVFRPFSAAEAEESNFCCRGGERASKEALVRDLSLLLSLPRTRLSQMGEENRRYVKEHYGELRMTRDALLVYERICKRRAVLCGYYGFHNTGDELLLRALCARLREEGYGEISVLSAKRRSLAALRALRRGYDFILGGGNLLQDATSERSLRFYLYVAARARGHIEIHGGIGPLSEKGRILCTPLCQRADALLCRTEGDLSLSKQLGAKNARLSADAALALPFPKRERGEGILLAFKTPGEEDAPAVLSFILSLCRTFGRDKIAIFVMHPKDLTFSRRAADLCGILCHRERDTDSFLSCIAKARMVFSSRLHAGIAALGIGVPFALWEGEEKNRFFVEDVKGVSEEKDFCALFSFSDRPKTLLSAQGIKEAKAALLRRL